MSNSHYTEEQLHTILNNLESINAHLEVPYLIEDIFKLRKALEDLTKSNKRLLRQSRSRRRRMVEAMAQAHGLLLMHEEMSARYYKVRTELDQLNGKTQTETQDLTATD